MSTSNEVLLEVKDLKKYFPVKKGFISKKVNYVKAVDGVSFTLRKGETLGLVGESGCGKSTTGRTILRLIEPTDGIINFDGENIVSLNKKELRKKRKDMQIIFQDPYSSLNPRLTAGEIIGRAIDVNNLAKGKERERRINELLDIVGLGARFYNRYPNEFSGGQRQRIGIARALACNPKLIVCDEPISALDVSIQAQIINLLQDIQDEFQLTYLFIAHNLAVVKHISDNIAVMYLGKIVEMADKNELFENPHHPYTKALLSAILSPNPKDKKERIKLEGDVPSPMNIPKGCRFYNRCPNKSKICSEVEPELKDMGGGHLTACHNI
ncbi:ABC transporter ATP-binding protein [Fonticella tunisiensis]|uniref:Oligopeptide transport system ATP-binding protein n=1 Tax=Fonticella tunisiensis TaxID=1096341 RepID=A0A4R7KDP6_9CLOT|nr:dipeptide ABC transporter ATP-binding protein [Fonticella tunisiensis]TDT51065.1 oligopeptide transport system ATP-binding protein [Fonticella tunisiensis]